MNTDTLQLIFYIAVIMHVAAGILTLACVIPLQLREAGVKNGLRKLRQQLLVKGLLSLAVIVFSIMALTGRSFLPDGLTRFGMITFVMAHAIGILGKAYIDYQIYHQQYTEESKRMHEKIDALEKAKAKRDAQNTSK